jgi:hypothetical protein
LGNRWRMSGMIMHRGLKDMDANDACVSVAWGTNQTGCPWVWSWSLLFQQNILVNGAHCTISVCSRGSDAF